MINQFIPELERLVGTSVEVIDTKRLIGGDINDVYRIRTKQGNFCIKVNSESKFPGMFEAEEKGLDQLRQSSSFRVPEVYGKGSYNDLSFLLMEYIYPGDPKQHFWSDFGHRLAHLHWQTSDQFGLSHSNYIGSLHQQNGQRTTWAEFFEHERLRPQLKLAYDQGYVSSKTDEYFERLFQRLGEIFPEEPATLLHGDLWNGNYMVDQKGNPVLIDPAVYYGHREMDLAMTKLFGGFGEAMYEDYHEIYPLENGWKSRVEICNLYPLLVHVNLFGRGYLTQVRSIVSRF